MIVSPDVQQLCAGITALSDQESLYHMIHSLIIMQDQKELSQFQLTANLRYFFSAVIQNSHKDIIYPDVSEIVSTSIPMMNWNGNFNTKLPKSAVSKILLSEKNFLLWPVRCAIIWTEILPNRSPRNLFRIFLAIMRNIFPHFSNQNSVSLPVNISVNFA